MGTQKFAINYLDADNDKIDVTDDYELQMAYATALSADNKVKYFIELPGFKHVVAPIVEDAPKVEQQPVPEIVAPQIQEKLVEKEVQQVPINPPFTDRTEVPATEESIPVVIDAELESDLPEQFGPMHHGKKGKKGKGKKG